MKKTLITNLKVGDQFKEHDGKYSPLYTIRKIENGKIYVDSSVTGLSEIRISKPIFVI